MYIFSTNNAHSIFVVDERVKSTQPFHLEGSGYAGCGTRLFRIIHTGYPDMEINRKMEFLWTFEKIESMEIQKI